MIWTFLVSLASAWTGDNAEALPGARSLWVGEHVDLYAKSLAAAGFDTGQSFELPAFGPGETVEGYDSLQPPSAWSEVGFAGTRTLNAQMFANLPDISYSLGDWALGNEVCPVTDVARGELTTARCHLFAGLMGALNSSHFPPQNKAAHAWYHQLALDNAARCDVLHEALSTLGADGSERDALAKTMVAECELETLALEGVGHHYLQDAWSSGHAWERWGSPRLSDWVASGDVDSDAAMLRAFLVGSFAGIIHGHKSITHVDDPMCSDDPDVWLIPPGGGEAEAFHAVGDHDLAKMVADQERRMTACTDASLGEVVEALGGADQFGLSAQATSFDADGCFDSRASNLAFYTGLFKTAGVSANEVEFALRWGGRLSLAAGALLNEDLGALLLDLRDYFRREAVVIMVTANAERWSTGAGAWGTELAELEVTGDGGGAVALTFLESTRNREWLGDMANAGLVVYDPAADVLAGAHAAPDDTREQAAAGVRNTFQRAHGDYWCTAFDANLDDPGSDLSVLSKTCQLPSDPHAKAACAACEEQVVRFLRDGDSVDDYNTADEPVCAAFDPDANYVYREFGSSNSTRRADVAKRVCEGGKVWVATDSAVYQVNANVVFGSAIDGATEMALTATAPLAGAALGEFFYFSGADGQLWQVSPATFDEVFGVGDCGGPLGMDVDAKDKVLYVACNTENTVASFDLTRSPPTFIEAISLPSLEGFPEAPTDVAVRPDGGLIAVSTEYLYGGRDGVTLIEVNDGAFGTANHPAVSGRYKFSASAGVDFSSIVRLWVSNFSYLECPGGSSASCTGSSGDYWVNSVSFTNVSDAVIDTQFAVDDRTSGVQRLWDDRAMISGFTSMNAYVVDATNYSAPTADVYIGEDRPDSFAPVQDSSRIFVGFSYYGVTCGLGMIDASDPEPMFWSYEGTDTSLGSCPRVVVPVP